MHRLWGSGAAAPKPPTLDQALASNATNSAARASKIEECSAKLRAFGAQREKFAKGSPAYNRLTQKMLPIYQQKTQLEAMQQRYEQQEMGIWQLQSTLSTLENSMTTVAAMEQSTKEMQKQIGKFDIDKIERMHDKMADLLDRSNEIQETLARSYDIPEDIDESELDAELDALAMEAPLESEAAEAGGIPSFMTDEVPEFIDEAPKVDAGKVQEAAR